MTTYKIIYFAFLLLAFIFSFFSNWKNDKSLLVFPILLFVSVITEAITYTLYAFELDYSIIYHVYIPIEYSLFAYYFSFNMKKNIIRKIILYSIPLYIIISLTISYISSFQKHPAIQINIEGLFLIIQAVTGLFSIEPKINNRITSIPFFWICIAVLVYHSGIFTFMGIYNYLVEQKFELGDKLSIFVLQISNYILYICLSIAFICSIRTKK